MLAVSSRHVHEQQWNCRLLQLHDGRVRCTYVTSEGATANTQYESGKFSITERADSYLACVNCPIGKSAPAASTTCSCTPPFAVLADGTSASAAGFTFDSSTSCERCDNEYFKTTTTIDPCTTCDLALKGSLSTRSNTC